MTAAKTAGPRPAGPTKYGNGGPVKGGTTTIPAPGKAGK